MVDIKYIQEMIKHAYYLDTNKTSIINISNDKLIYSMPSLWCTKDSEIRSMLRILHNISLTYPELSVNISEDFLDKFPVTPDSGPEECWIVGYLTAMNLYYEADTIEVLTLEDLPKEVLSIIVEDGNIEGNE